VTNLNRLREENNLTVKDMAHLLKVTSGKYLSWENDTADIPSMYLYSLSYLFGVGYDEIIAYEKQEDLDFSMRRDAVKKRYTKRITKILIALTVIAAFIATAISILVNLAPQIHAKMHADSCYSQAVDYVHERFGDDMSVEKLLGYANKNCGIQADIYMSSVAIVPVSRQFMIFFSNGKQKNIIDITSGFLTVAHGNIYEGEYSYSFEIVGYSIWYYLVIYEDGNPPLKDLIDCYSASLEKSLEK
jgi:transcriptional regulator with XRE-family HTH domain